MVASIKYISSPKVSHAWHIKWLQSKYSEACVMLDLQWLANIERRRHRLLFSYQSNISTGYLDDTEAGIVGADLMKVRSFPQTCISCLQKFLCVSLWGSV